MALAGAVVLLTTVFVGAEAVGRMVRPTSAAEHPGGAVSVGATRTSPSPPAPSGAVAEADGLRSVTRAVFAVTRAERHLREARDEARAAVAEDGPDSDAARAASEHLFQDFLELDAAVRRLPDGFTGELPPAMRRQMRRAGLTGRQVRHLERSYRDASQVAASLAAPGPPAGARATAAPGD